MKSYLQNSTASLVKKLRRMNRVWLCKRYLFKFIIIFEIISLAKIALKMLDPFDFRAFGSFAQGDCLH